VITYEYPLNERIRTLLRLEDLYDKVSFFAGRGDDRDHHVALMTLFEILEVAGRADLKSDLLQELERQKHVLEALRNNPAISEETLESVLADIEKFHATLHGAAGKTGQHLRDNEWLMSIKQRSGIPGGVCEFDLPSYHYWLHQDPQIRREDVWAWLAPLLPIAEALRMVLKLLRESARPTPLIAYQGVFQLMPAGKLAQMLRVRLNRDLPCIPEISANKYALNIRFITAETTQRTRLYEHDVEFDLTFCNL
jgi:cell division protein ZapD